MFESEIPKSRFALFHIEDESGVSAQVRTVADEHTKYYLASLTSELKVVVGSLETI